MTRGIFGKLFGDKGYLSHTLYDDLCEAGIDLITYCRRPNKPSIQLDPAEYRSLAATIL